MSLTKKRLMELAGLKEVDSDGFEHIPDNYDVMYKGSSLTAPNTIIRMGTKGGEYKVSNQGGRIILTNVKNSSDKIVADSEQELLRLLQDYVDPKGGTQSSQF
jgi:hypothetical protein